MFPRWTLATAVVLTALAFAGTSEGQMAPAWTVSLPDTQRPKGMLVTHRWLGGAVRVVADVGNLVLVFNPDGSPDPAWQQFPYPISGQRVVALADVTGDGVVEVVSTGTLQIPGNGGRAVWVRDTEGTVVPGWPVYESSLNISNAIDLLAGDLDGVPGAEVVVLDLPPKIHALSRTGELMSGWPVSIPYPGGSFQEGWGGTAIADLDMNGTPEIVACPVFVRGNSFIPTPIHVFNLDGTHRTGWPFQVYGLWLNWPMVADLNGDFACEIGVVGIDVVAMLHRHGQLLTWPFPIVPCGSFYAWPAGTADLTGDRIPDFVTSGGCLTILDPTIPQFVASYAPVNTGWFNPLIGDVNGDGAPEIVVQAQNLTSMPTLEPRIYVFDSNLQVLPGFPVYLEPYSTLPPNHGQITRQAIALGDLNGDGDLEIVQGFTARVLMWDLPSQGNPSTEYAWTHWRGNEGATGFLYEGRYPPAFYRRGDANRDTVVDVGDVSAMLRRLLLGQPTKCLAQYDFNDTDTVDLADPLDLLLYLFAGGPMAAGAYPNCEVTKPLTEPLGCYEYECP